MAASPEGWAFVDLHDFRNARLRPGRDSVKEVAAMNRLGMLLSVAVVLGLVCGAYAEARPGKPDKPAKPGEDRPKTQACTLSGDASGAGVVGIDAKSYGPLEMTGLGGMLDGVFVSAGFSPNGSYTGQGRVLKKQGRLDLSFGVTEPDCRPGDWGEEPGPGTGICQYQLILVNGVFDRKGDEVVFSATGGTEVLLYDSWLAAEDRLISGGTADLLVQFED
jgi:hypothetical protein